MQAKDIALRPHYNTNKKKTKKYDNYKLLNIYGKKSLFDNSPFMSDTDNWLLGNFQKGHKSVRRKRKRIYGEYRNCIR